MSGGDGVDPIDVSIERVYTKHGFLSLSCRKLWMIIEEKHQQYPDQAG